MRCLFCAIRKLWSRRSKALRSVCQRSSNCWATWRSSSTPSLGTTSIWRLTKAEPFDGQWHLPSQELFLFFSFLPKAALRPVRCSACQTSSWGAWVCTSCHSFTLTVVSLANKLKVSRHNRFTGSMYSCCQKCTHTRKEHKIILSVQSFLQLVFFLW